MKKQRIRKAHIIGSPEIPGRSSHNSHLDPSGKETSRNREYRKSSPSGTVSVESSRKRVRFKSTDSLAPAKSKTIKRSRAETLSTNTGKSLPNALGDRLCDKGVLKVCQFLRILNPSVDDILFLLSARDMGLCTASLLADHFQWDASRVRDAMDLIAKGTGLRGWIPPNSTSATPQSTKRDR